MSFGICCHLAFITLFFIQFFSARDFSLVLKHKLINIILNIMRYLVIIVFTVLFVLTSITCQEPQSSADLAARRNYLANLINQVRASQNLGLGPLYLDVALNGLAQAHSIDMVNRGFFSHINPSGLNAQQRATAAGFNYSVGENIAYGQSLTSVHLALMGSAPHFANTVNANWTRVGVGISNKGKLIYVTIVFSTRDFTQYPLTDAENQQMLTNIKNYLTQNNKNIKTEIKQLSNHLSNWLKANRNPPLIFDFLEGSNYPIISMSYQYTEMQWSKDIVQVLQDGKYLQTTSDEYNKFGVGFYVSSNGWIIIAVIFST